ncbi:MAG: cytochrome d ubiquinol oxidase subunit II [Rhodospirillales bacterium]|nr:cytochrome d ubiquinol oxidase subunit II [Rhodospirillales bacterium]
MRYGAAIGNVLQGVEFHFSWDGQYYQDGSFIWYLLNPFAILCGVVSIALSIQQAGAMLMIRGEEPIYGRARQFGMAGGLVAAVLFVVGGIWMQFIKGFVYAGPIDPGMAATPLDGPPVVTRAGAWMDNFSAHPVLWLVPLAGLVGMLGAVLALGARKPVLGWWLGALAWIGTIGTVGAAMFPFLMPSTSEPSQSLSVWNASSSAYTLGWMLVFTVIFVPAVVSYTSWAFRIMGGKIRAESVAKSDYSY